MTYTFEKYQQRKIVFEQLIEVNDWSIKVYSITHQHRFSAMPVLHKALEEIPHWLPLSSPLPLYHLSFLIVHEAREGIWILFNWWTGGEMLETQVYFSKNTTNIKFTPSIYTPKSLVCVWELEVIFHERKAWIKHVLSDPKNYNFKNYLTDNYIQTDENIS